MNRIICVLLVGILSVTSVGASGKGASGLSVLQQEAFEIGKQYLGSRLLKCDDIFFYKYTWGISAGTPSIFQVLDPEVVLLDGGPISSVDQLNGLEWSGGMKFKFRAIRVLEQNPGTGSWGQWVERPNGINIAYVKSGGQWAMNPSMDGAFADPPASCGDIAVKPPPVAKKDPAPEKSTPAKPFKI